VIRLFVGSLTRSSISVFELYNFLFHLIFPVANENHSHLYSATNN